jgi:hypothetical protein
MEKMMSKSNDTSRPATLEDHRPLADSELDAVSGGVDDGTFWDHVITSSAINQVVKTLGGKAKIPDGRFTT